MDRNVQNDIRDSRHRRVYEGQGKAALMLLLAVVLSNLNLEVICSCKQRFNIVDHASLLSLVECMRNVIETLIYFHRFE